MPCTLLTLSPMPLPSSLQGRGTVVTGRVEQGIVKTGDEVEIVGIRPQNTKSTVTGARCCAGLARVDELHDAALVLGAPLRAAAPQLKTPSSQSDLHVLFADLQAWRCSRSS